MPNSNCNRSRNGVISNFYNGTSTTTANGGYAMTTFGSYTSANYGTQTSWYIRLADFDIDGNSIVSPMYFNTSDTYSIEWGPDNTVWRITFALFNDYSGYIRLAMDNPSLDEFPYGTDDMLNQLNTLGVAAFNAGGLRVLSIVENATSFLVYNGNCNFTGLDATFIRALKLSADAGAYSVAGQVATFV